jgi:hypothetical protein
MIERYRGRSGTISFATLESSLDQRDPGKTLYYESMYPIRLSLCLWRYYQHRCTQIQHCSARHSQACGHLIMKSQRTRPLCKVVPSSLVYHGHPSASEILANSRAS